MIENKPYKPRKRKFNIQYILDRLVNHVIIRWAIFVVLMLAYYVRVFVIYKGYYVVTYCLAVSTLSLVIRFITPEDPDEVSDVLGEMILPGISSAAPHSTPSSVVDDEFRPFMRSLPEFQFWQKTVIYLLIAHVVVTFKIFDIRVYPLILLLYFITFFIITIYTPVRRFFCFFIKLYTYILVFGEQENFHGIQVKLSIIHQRNNNYLIFCIISFLI
jgi:hypothetical protein